MLASTVRNCTNIYQEMIDYIIQETKECLEGRRDSVEAETTSLNLWEYCKSRWPEYIRDSQTSNQEDAAEFLLRILMESENIKNQVGSTMQVRKICINPHCPSASFKDTQKEYIHTSQIPNKSTLNLQEIIDKYLMCDEPIVCLFCNEKGKETKKMEKAPKLLLIQVPRLKSENTRINTKIRCPTGTVAIRDSKDQIVIYNVVGVITHAGGVKSGHYIYNHYVQEERKWLTIDDHRIKFGDVKESNEQGTVFILRKSPTSAFDRLTPESTISASLKPITDIPTETFSVTASEPTTLPTTEKVTAAPASNHKAQISTTVLAPSLSAQTSKHITSTPTTSLSESEPIISINGGKMQKDKCALSTCAKAPAEHTTVSATLLSTSVMESKTLREKPIKCIIEIFETANERNRKKG